VNVGDLVLIPALAFVWFPIIIAIVVTAAVIGAGVIIIYQSEIREDHAHCWDEIMILRSSSGGVCKYAGPSGTVKEIPLTEIRDKLRDETAACPPKLKVRLCEFEDGAIVVRRIETVP
jgi:hypothetical protein